MSERLAIYAEGQFETLNGKTGHGEDQDMWPVHTFAALQRKQRST